MDELVHKESWSEDIGRIDIYFHKGERRLVRFVNGVRDEVRQVVDEVSADISDEPVTSEEPAAEAEAEEPVAEVVEVKPKKAKKDDAPADPGDDLTAA